MVRPTFLSILVLLLFNGCSPTGDTPRQSLARLTGQAILPADTFVAGPAVGSQLESEINGRHLPCATVPVQGFSSLIITGPQEYLVLQDNGFGTMANSLDFPLRWYRLRVSLHTATVAQGSVEVLGFQTLHDSRGLLPFQITNPDSGRVLTGADLDPESFVQNPDGTFWIGEEFGPSLLLVSPTGEVLCKPVSVPIPQTLRAFSRGSPFYRTPDHPDLRFFRRSETRDELANLPRSGGIEGLARNHDRSRLYLALEKGLRDDLVGNRRSILEFDPARRSFSGRTWAYLTTADNISIASLAAVNDTTFLVLERGPGSGKTATIKRIYRIVLDHLDNNGYLRKELACDLLNIDDSRGLTAREPGAIGLGPVYRFPYVTPECLAVLNDSTIVVANDNNYPMSSGRRPPHEPDDNEFIRLRLERSLGGRR